MTNQEEACTYPGNAEEQNAVTPRVIVSPMYKDPVTGALYVHRDLEEVTRGVMRTRSTLPLFDEAGAGRRRAVMVEIRQSVWVPGHDVRDLRALGGYVQCSTTTRGRSQDAHQWSVLYQFHYAPQFERWHRALALDEVGGIGHQAFVELLEDGMEAIVDA